MLFVHVWCEITLLAHMKSGTELGSIPRSITAILLEDLIDTCKPGDDVTLVGVVVRRWSALGKGQEGRTDIELALKANHLQVHNDR